MTENHKSTSYDNSGRGTANWAVPLGLVAALVLGGVLYFSFSGDLIDERSTAVPPTGTSAPLDTRSSDIPPQPSAPSTK